MIILSKNIFVNLTISTRTTIIWLLLPKNMCVNLRGQQWELAPFKETKKEV